jgi:hypothetical protein
MTKKKTGVVAPKYIVLANKTSELNNHTPPVSSVQVIPVSTAIDQIPKISFPVVSTTSSYSEQELMAKLRGILLKDDRPDIHQTKEVLDKKDLLGEKVNPIIDEHIDYLKQHFPKEYTKVVNRMIDAKIKDSQAEIINIMYPVLGTMIKKYIQFLFQEMKEDIDNKMKSMFSGKGKLWHLKNKLLGRDSSAAIIASLDTAILEEIFIIQHNSGLVIGSASLNPIVNRDVVGGMLTAIKAFVEDAFEQEKEHLELVQYGTYRIMLQNFHSYYFALAIKGSMSATESNNFRNQVFDFSQKTTELHNEREIMDHESEISGHLLEHFIAPQRKKLKDIKI